MRVGGQGRDDNPLWAQMAIADQVGFSGLRDSQDDVGSLQGQEVRQTVNQPLGRAETLWVHQGDQVINSDYRGHAGPVGHQVIGTVIKGGPGAAQLPWHNPLLTQGERRGRTIQARQSRQAEAGRVSRGTV